MIDFYSDFGLTYKGLLAGRANDTAGIGFAYGRISPQLIARDRDMVAFTGVPMPIPDYEATIELTYQAKITRDWAIQPDLLYIIHPGGSAPNPLDPTSRIPNALVAGVRTIVEFGLQGGRIRRVRARPDGSSDISNVRTPEKPNRFFGTPSSESILKDYAEFHASPRLVHPPIGAAKAIFLGPLSSGG